MGNGDGSFQAAQNYAAGYSGPLAVADLNGDGYLDLAVADGSVLINAADWGGGHAPAPFRRPASRAMAPRQALLETAWAFVGASQPQSVRPMPVPSMDLQPSPVKLGPMKTEIGQPNRPEAVLPPMPVFIPRQGPGLLSEPWVDPVIDVLAWNLLR